MRIKPWTGSAQSQQAKDSNGASPRIHSHHIHHKIHPDLSSLLDETPHKKSEELIASEDVTKSPYTGSPDFISLTSSTRTRRFSALIQDNVLKEKSREPNQSVSTSSNSSGTGGNLSGETFGQGKQKRSNSHHKRLYDATTPSPERTEDESSRLSKRTTPESNSGASRSERSRRTTASSRNTFGTPSPGYNLSSQHKHRTSPEMLPPMPPLDHPAFQSISACKQAKNLFEQPSFITTNRGRSLNFTRHSRSLPTLTQKGRILSRKRRTRTQSTRAPIDFFSEAKSSTPVSHHKTHARSQSNVSKSSSRRASAEFSAERASLVSHRSDASANWEAQVAREMVRLSLCGHDEEEMAGGTGKHMAQSQSGQARGHHPVRTPLGSPFLLQHAHPHSISPPAHCYNTPYISKSGSDRRVLSSAAMSRTASHLSPKPKSKTPERTRTPSPRPKIKTASSPASGVASTSHLIPPALSLTAATPDPSPITPISYPTIHTSTEPLVSVLRMPDSPSAAKTTPVHKGKRKADEAGVEGGGTPPKEIKEPRATFAVDPRPHRISANSNSTRSAPSSYHRKRARLSTTPESRPGSRQSSEIQNAATVGSWSSKNSGYATSQQHHSTQIPPPAHHRPSSRRSLSQASIPMSALISPHAPSIARSSLFHMRDPHKPSPVHSTPWSLSFPSGRAGENEGWRGWMNRGGSPLHAWLFFVGFVLFPLWWVASFWGIPATRRLDGGEQEKGVILDDPQVEHDAKSWRMRCRVMAGVSFVTYIPFVVLVAVFA